MLFVFLTLIVRVILSPLLVVFVTIAYTSIWLPQIVRSARRGRTSGLASEYIFGTTACRLYFLLCKWNVCGISEGSDVHLRFLVLPQKCFRDRIAECVSVILQVRLISYEYRLDTYFGHLRLTSSRSHRVTRMAGSFIFPPTSRKLLGCVLSD